MKLRHLLTGLGALGSVAAANAAVVVVTGDITSNTTWSSGNQYVLQGSAANQGVIRVLPGVTLTINQNTIIRGQPRTDASTYDAGSLAVLRGARIIANGTKDQPIIFTTAAVDVNADGTPDGFVRNGLPGSGGTASVIATRYDATTHGTNEATVPWWDAAPLTSPRTNTATGLWGGVLVLGKAPVNYAADADLAGTTSTENGNYDSVGGTLVTPYYFTKPIVEGLNSPDYSFGSDWSDGTDGSVAEALPAGTPVGYVRENYIDADDDSGSLTYISIRHGGIQLAADNEINGLTLAGVGRGTKVAFIEVWGNEDDGIEIFGGTVNLSNVIVTGTKDDGIDLDLGYSGQIQFGCVIGGSYAEKLLEWDGDDSAETGRESMANYAPRATWEARNLTLIGASTDRGAVANLRNNASCKLYNTIIYNSRSATAFSIQTDMWTVMRNVSVNGANTSLPTGDNLIQSNVSTANVNITAPVFVTDIITGDTPATMSRPSVIDVIPSGLPVSSVFALPSASSSVGNTAFWKIANYRGAFDPSAAGKWTDTWTAANRSGAL